MPVQYPTGTLAEHRAVRDGVGVFDVSHMGRIGVDGSGAGRLLDLLITSDLMSLKIGRARYGLMCLEDGGILDDVVTLRLEAGSYMLVCNAASWNRVTRWIADHAETVADVTITPRRDETAMIAVQGPAAGEALRAGCGINVTALRRFGVSHERSEGDIRVELSRTGYTGEDGYELIVDAPAATAVWDSLVNDGGAVPCGLGARDTLRLEAGFSLYGQDIDTTTTPLEAGLDRFVDPTGDFIGSDALHRQSTEGVKRRLVGFVVEGRSAPRHGYEIRAPGTDDVIGTVTSGGPSPTLGTGIGLGYLRVEHTAPGTGIEVDIRGRTARGEVVPAPFYQRES
jgi:aminomethyltransferase